MSEKTSSSDGWEELFRLMRAGKVSPNSDGFYVVDKSYKSVTPNQTDDKSSKSPDESLKDVKLIPPIQQSLERVRRKKERKNQERKDNLS